MFWFKRHESWASYNFFVFFSLLVSYIVSVNIFGLFKQIIFSMIWFLPLGHNYYKKHIVGLLWFFFFFCIICVVYNFTLVNELQILLGIWERFFLSELVTIEHVFLRVRTAGTYSFRFSVLLILMCAIVNVIKKTMAGVIMILIFSQLFHMHCSLKNHPCLGDSSESNFTGSEKQFYRLHPLTPDWASEPRGPFLSYFSL